MQKGKRPKSNDSTHLKPKKWFVHKESSIGNKDRAPKKKTKEVAVLWRVLGVLLVESNICVSDLPEWMVVLDAVVRATS